MRVRVNLIAVSLIMVGAFLSCKDEKGTTYDQCFVTEMSQVYKFENESFEVIDKFTYNNANQLTRWVSNEAEYNFEILFSYGSDGKLNTMTVEENDIDSGQSEIETYSFTYSDNLIKMENNNQGYSEKMEVILENGKVIRCDEYRYGSLNYQSVFTWNGENITSQKTYSSGYYKAHSSSKSVKEYGSYSILKRFLARNRNNRTSDISRNSGKEKLAELQLFMTIDFLHHDSENGLKLMGAFFFTQSAIALNQNNASQIKFSSEYGDVETIKYSNFKVNDSGYPVKVDLTADGYTTAVTFKYQCE